MEHLTVSAQDLIVLVLDREYVTYRTQKIYSSRKFYKVVSFLRRNDLINPVCVSCKRGIKDNHRNTCGSRDCDRKRQTSHRMFELTLRGELVAHELKSLVK